MLKCIHYLPMKRRGGDLISLLHLIFAAIVNVEILTSWFYPIIFGEQLYSLGSFAERLLITLVMYSSIIALIAYILLLLLNRKVALRLFRILITLLPFLLFLATISEVSNHGLYYLIERIATYKP